MTINREVGELLQANDYTSRSLQRIDRELERQQSNADRMRERVDELRERLIPLETQRRKR